MKTVQLQAATPYLAAYVIFRKGNKVAFVLRENTGWMDGFYGLAAGKVEEDETATQGAIREAKEEVGITLKREQLKPVLVAHRQGDDSDWIDIMFEATSWEGELVNAEPHMHKEITWLDLKELPENIIPAVRYYIEQIEAGKHYAEFGWD